VHHTGWEILIHHGHVEFIPPRNHRPHPHTTPQPTALLNQGSDSANLVNAGQCEKHCVGETYKLAVEGCGEALSVRYPTRCATTATGVSGCEQLQ
jgi:hypothetical protein